MGAVFSRCTRAQSKAFALHYSAWGLCAWRRGKALLLRAPAMKFGQVALTLICSELEDYSLTTRRTARLLQSRCSVAISDPPLPDALFVLVALASIAGEGL